MLNGLNGHHSNPLRQKQPGFGNVTVVLGAQWGDEGKGKIIDVLALEADVVCRCQGGNNAGHTVVVDDKEYDFHLLPSSIIQKNCKSLIGNGVVIHLPSLFQELEKNNVNDSECASKLIVSDRAHLVFDFHQTIDRLQEEERNKGNSQIGTTKKGIGPAYSSKTWRCGLRICDLLGNWSNFEHRFRTMVSHYSRQFSALKVDIDKELELYKAYASKLKDLNIVRDTVSYLNNMLIKNHKVMVEGANGAMLDIDFGTYPYVTSSNCTIGGVITGLGISPQHIGDIYGVAKAYTTRVGGGLFPTELNDDIGNYLCETGREIGVTTGRKRRCGWLDLVLLRYSHIINGFTALVLTKLDVLDGLKEIKVGVRYKIDENYIDFVPASTDEMEKVCVDYKSFPGWESSTKHIQNYVDLPENARKYIEFIESHLGCPVKWIGVGKDRASLIKKT